MSDAPPEDEDVFRRQLDHRAVALRRELGNDLLPEFARLNREFDRVLSLLGPEDWDKLCYHRLRPGTARAKADIRIAELAIFGQCVAPYGGALAAGGRPAEIA